MQGLIATSRNGLRVLTDDAIQKVSALPLFVVGRRPGRWRASGLSNRIEGPARRAICQTSLRPRAEPETGPLSNINRRRSGVRFKSALAARHFELRQAIVYRARAAEALAPQVVEAIANSAIEGVVLMSPRTATIFSDLAARQEFETRRLQLAYFCLSEAVAGALTARLAPSRVKIARLPNLQEMLALLAGARQA